MSLSNSAAGLLQVVERYQEVVRQERLIETEEEMEKKLKNCLEQIHEIEKMAEVDEELEMERIEEILGEIGRTCSKKIREESAAKFPKTVLLTHENKNFVLSKNITRPQIVKAPQWEGAHGNRTDQNVPYFGQRNLELLRKMHVLLGRAEKSVEAPSVVVKTDEEFERAVEEIEKELFIGVDIKAHRFRSYGGVLCYVQISTPEKLYILDAVALKNIREKLLFLANGRIGKLMFKMGKKRSMLEKALGREVPECYDVSAVHPSLSGTSVRALIKDALGGSRAKRLHLCDWRYRGMTEEMKRQMEDDVKCILPVFSLSVRNDTLEEFLRKMQAEERAAEPAGPESFAAKFSLELTQGLKETYLLREFIAKQEDESPSYVLTDYQMKELLEKMPRTPEEVFSLFVKVSPLFKAHLNNFLRVLHHEKKSDTFSIEGLKNL